MTDKVVLLFVVALAAAAPPAAAQSHRASMRGLVTDSTGAVLRGANVEATQRTTNERRTVTTDEGGRFAVPELPVGPYVVEITLAGYRSHTTRADLAVGEELWLDVPLNPSIEQSVEVNAPLVPIERDSAAMGTLIDTRQIIGLPLDGRNFLELTLLAPGTGTGAAGFGQLGARRLRVQRERRARGCEHLPARRRLQRRPQARHGRRPPAGRCHPRVRGPDVHLRRVVRAQRRRAGQRRHALGHQRFTGPPTNSSAAERSTPQPTSPRDAADARLRPQPVRRFHRRSDRPRSRVLLRRLRGHTPRRGDHASHQRADAAERWAIFRSRCSPACRSVHATAVSRTTGSAVRASGWGVRSQRCIRCRTARLPLANYVSSPTLHDDVRSIRRCASITRSATRRASRARYSFGDRRLLEPFAGTGFSTVPGFGNDVARRGQNLAAPIRRTLGTTMRQRCCASATTASPSASFQQNPAIDNASVGLPALSTDPRDAGMSLISVAGYSRLGHEYNNPQESASNTFQMPTRAPGRAARICSSSAASTTACASRRIATCRRAAS